MPTITYSWTNWCRIIATLRSRDESWMREHAAVIEERLEEHGPCEERDALLAERGGPVPLGHLGAVAARAAAGDRRK
jgi:hypothetical protein